jgi:hypothetical protein
VPSPTVPNQHNSPTTYARAGRAGWISLVHGVHIDMGCLHSQPQDPLGRPTGAEHGVPATPVAVGHLKPIQEQEQGIEQASLPVSEQGPSVASQKQASFNNRLGQRVSSEVSSTAVVITPARSGQQPPVKEEPDPGGVEDRLGYDKEPDSTLSPLRSVWVETQVHGIDLRSHQRSFSCNALDAGT